jgi:hypothetical protein
MSAFSDGQALVAAPVVKSGSRGDTKYRKTINPKHQGEEMDRKFVFTALIYAVIGLLLGIYMAATDDHSLLVDHAHIMLVGFVLSFIYALCHRLWLGNTRSGLAVAQFYIHQVGAFFIAIGLFLLYGRFLPREMLDALFGVASVAVLIGVILMTVLFVKAPKSASVS